MNRIVKTVIFIAILAGFASCAEETMEEIPAPSIPEGYIRAALDLQVEGNDSIQTRVTDPEEQAYDKSNVWVLLFKATSSSDSTPDELLQAPVKAVESGNKLYVLLRSTSDPVTIYVVAGLSADLNTTMAGISEGTGFAAVNAALQTAPLTSIGVPVGVNVPQVGVTSYFHMSSDPEFYADGTMPLITTPLSLSLTRNVAKINVDASAIHPDTFLLEEVILVNGAQKGYVLRQAAISANNGGVMRYEEKASVSGNKLTSQIYLYENAGMNGTTPNPTMLIVRGKYKGVSGFYRMDLLKRNSNGTYTPYNIERNHCYTLTITKLENSGYTTPDQAIVNEPSNKWPQTDITITDTNPHDIVSNGRYYLGVTNSEFIIYGNTTASQTIVAVTTNAPSGTQTSITLSPPNPGFTIPLASLQVNGTVRTTSITANLRNFAIGDSAYIDLRVGNLTRRITIRKRAGVGTALSDITDFSAKNYVAGKVNSGTGMRFATKPGVDFSSCYTSLVHSGLFIRCNSGTATGELYISRANNEGRVKVAVYR